MKNRPKEISNHKEFINQLNDNGLTQLVTKPTRLENTLDLMKTNNPTRVNRTEMLPGISDHEVVLCELDITPTTNKQIKRLPHTATWGTFSKPKRPPLIFASGYEMPAQIQDGGICQCNKRTLFARWDDRWQEKTKEGLLRRCYSRICRPCWSCSFIKLFFIF